MTLIIRIAKKLWNELIGVGWLEFSINASNSVGLDIRSICIRLLD